MSRLFTFQSHLGLTDNTLLTLFPANPAMLSQSEDSSTSVRPESDSEFNYFEGEEDPFINSLWGIHKTLDALRGKIIIT